MNVIYFDAERLKYKNVGLYHFCLQLGTALLQQEAADPDVDLYIYTPPSCRIFDGKPKYVDTKIVHKIFQPFKPKPNIWHATYQLTDFLPTSRNIRKVLTVHDLNFLREKTEPKQKKYLKKLQSNVDKADVLVCISNFVKEELEDHCDIRGKDVHVIYNGNNIKEYIIAQQPERAGLNLSQPFIFSVGAVLKKKNFHTLPYLLVGNNYNLVIAGDIADKRYYEEIITIASALGVEKRVFLIGQITEQEKYSLLEQCSLFCFPSITEGFGLPVVEAMHFGCSILLSNATSLPEIGGDVVRYFDNFDTDYLKQLGARIDSFHLSDKEKREVKERANLFSWENAAKAYWEIYKELL